jgi:tetratricopeptide (TPR) repeat protein
MSSSIEPSVGQSAVAQQRQLRIAALEGALAQEGESAEGYLELGGLKLECEDFRGAVAAYRRCVELRPSEAVAHNNLGVALLLDRQIETAIATFETASALDANYHRPLVNLGKALREAGRPDEAIVRLQRALRLVPDNIGALVNLGDALAASGDLTAAQAALERASSLAPALPETQRSLAIARLQAGRVAESIAVLRNALRHAPGHASLHCCLHEVLFAAGQWEEAWPHFEWRFEPHERRTQLDRPQHLPRWDGIVHPGRELWLVGEQGLGDQIQFVRYARLLQQAGLSCTVSCDRHLLRVLSSAGLGVRIVERGTPVDTPRACWAPLMSLPAYHRTRPDNVPYAAGYLSDDAARVAHWQGRLSAVQRPRIAMAWSGNPSMETGRHVGRSFPLAALSAVLAIEGVRFLSLQKGPGSAQADSEPFRSSLLRFESFDPEPEAFIDTAAILRCVDLLITSDSAIAHLAGALGVRTWLCLHCDPDWRWLRRGASTPWYTSVQLFRQQRPGDWAGVFEEVAAELRAELAG